MLGRHHAIVRRELKRHGGREIDTAGDGFFATFDAPADGIRCACAASDAVRELGIDIRAGLHFGECEAIGKKVGGIAVHTGARVLSASGPHDVVATAMAKDLVAGSGIEFEDAGVHELKGIPGEWRLFRVSSIDGGSRGVALDEETKRERQAAIQPTPLLAKRRGVLAAVGAVVLAAIVGSAFLPVARRKRRSRSEHGRGDPCGRDRVHGCHLRGGVAGRRRRRRGIGLGHQRW